MSVSLPFSFCVGFAECDADCVFATEDTKPRGKLEGRRGSECVTM